VLESFFPKQSLLLGVLADLRASEHHLSQRASRLTKNVAKTLEISTFTKIMLLWLQFGGPPINAAAATATLFSQTLIKPMKY
jgi:hypothetical protein